MLSRTGQVKILDYGLAWIKGEPKERVQGTPEYMAPETARSKTVNELSDIYNFGATMYRLATWKLPPSVFGAAGLSGGASSVSSKSWKEAYEPVCQVNTNIPAALGVTIDKCLSFKPEYRPERISEIADVLENLYQEIGDSDEE
jgi:eukaryotic-like serine/threonine-protein kinase